MFRCADCGNVSKPREARNLVVTKTRKKEYPYRPKAFKFWQNGKEERRDDSGGTGVEIVAEKAICKSCLEAY